jgi:hypothetical protein
MDNRGEDLCVCFVINLFCYDIDLSMASLPLAVIWRISCKSLSI